MLGLILFLKSISRLLLHSWFITFMKSLLVVIDIVVFLCTYGLLVVGALSFFITKFLTRR